MKQRQQVLSSDTAGLAVGLYMHRLAVGTPATTMDSTVARSFSTGSSGARAAASRECADVAFCRCRPSKPSAPSSAALNAAAIRRDSLHQQVTRD